MVSRVEEAMKIRQHEVKNNQVQKQLMQCNKGKTNKFKRSRSNVEEDGASFAILLLACIACVSSNHI
ncbi:hypothetical protein RND71_010268 [Anisodus tanguticus]|uniref:Uncharacterized protein n=1 Tax=Anisodus tanguticus TaxID=243964 RepID=A0AAE1VI08_9SOLA|nr:hypothetical protein RND71_010268 [Anisodus tanguticus]